MNRREFLHSTLLLPLASSVAPTISFALDKGKAPAPGEKKSLPVHSGLNPKITEITCLRCRKVYPPASGVGDNGKGCPECLAQGFPANLAFSYGAISSKAFVGKGVDLKRYRDRLPLLDFPTLGEGNTPLIPLPTLARKLGLSQLYAKDESRGPTGSHKDRMSGLVVGRALQLKRPGVVAASSGNGAHSLGAYAASAGMPCLILATKKLTAAWKRAIESTGAKLELTNTSEERWKVMQGKVEKEHWYPATNFLAPPIGSNFFGLQGLKTIAYEILDTLNDDLPDAILVPTCRGDLLWGLYEGFREARAAKLIPHLPRLYAVEPFPRLERILRGEDYRTKFTQPRHPMVSIGGTTSTYQAETAVRSSQGGACSVITSEVFRARDELSSNGLYLELSSAAVLAGLYSLVARQAVRKGERVVLIGTSHGYKDLQPPT
jgi:threonine synthase